MLTADDKEEIKKLVAEMIADFRPVPPMSVGSLSSLSEGRRRKGSRSSLSRSRLCRL
jgi:hypothetical protein